jgi:large exoprotein involved in heme utilization and adhesion
VGVQLGSQAESIVNQSLSLNDFDEPVGLEVPPESNLTLVGGEINFEGGVVTAPNGSIELGSVAPHSLVNIIPTENNWTLDYTGIDNFQDLNLTQAASINSSGNGAGNINIHVNNLNVLDGSKITANNNGEKDGGSLNINAQELIQVAGAKNDRGYSLITAEVYDTGDGANLTIETKSLQANDVSIVSTANFGTGKGGNLTIKATEKVLVSGRDIALIATNAFNSGDGGNLIIQATDLTITDSAFISASTNSSGDAGNLSINVERLTIGDGLSQVASSTFGDGNAGDVTVRASESVEISGTGLVPSFEVEYQLFASGLFASVEPGATGNGGNLIIETSNLSVFEGGRVVTNTLGEGDAGNILIRADNLEVRDSIIDLFSTRSGITSTVEFKGSGNGGNLDIIVNNLNLIDGGSIAVNAKGKGHAGNINIQAQKINISGVLSSEPVHGFEQQSLPSEISASSLGDYDAGSITIDTETLNLNNQGGISVSNLGNGNAGNLNITATELNFDRSAKIEAEVNAGNQGNINLTTDNIFLRNNSEITAKATDTATGGNVAINNTDNIVLLKNSKIIADAMKGNGGNINITTQGLFVSPNGLISASSELGLDGNVEIKEISGDRNFEFHQLPEKIVDTTNLITPSCSANDNNGFATIGNGGVPSSPYSTQSLSATWYDLRPVKPEKSEIVALSTSLQEASATIINSDGELELVALTFLSSDRWVKSSCGN